MLFLRSFGSDNGLAREAVTVKLKIARMANFMFLSLVSNICSINLANGSIIVTIYYRYHVFHFIAHVLYFIIYHSRGIKGPHLPDVQTYRQVDVSSRRYIRLNHNWKMNSFKRPS